MTYNTQNQKSPEPSEPSLAKAFVIASFVNLDEKEINLEIVEKQLSSVLGVIDYKSTLLNSRLKKELYGHPNSQSKILGFEGVIARKELVYLAQQVYKIQKNRHKKQKVELELGYVTEFSCVLSALEETRNRIYLYNGVFAENIYFYEMMSFRVFPHTSLYFKQTKVITVFNDLHMILVNTS